MTTQTPASEERISRLEGAYEQVNERLGDLTQGQTSLREEIRQVDANLREGIRQVDTNLRAEVGALRSDMNARFNILLVLIGGVWATMAGGFIALFTQL